MSRWIPKKGLVLVAYESDGQWQPYCLMPVIGPPERELHTEWRWVACTLRSNGSVQIVEKPIGARRWEKARMIA